MGPVRAEIEIDVPRGEVFEAIVDLSRRPSFADHFISDFHLTRIDPSGVGAGARFRLTAGPRAVWVDTTIAVAEPPHRIVERGCGGRANRIPSTTVWELLEGDGSMTEVCVSHWTEPSRPLDRAVEMLLGGSIWQERAWREALRRLRALLESDAALPVVSVGGGNPHTTGVP